MEAEDRTPEQTAGIGFPSAASHLSGVCEHKDGLCGEAGKYLFPLHNTKKAVCLDLWGPLTDILLLSRGNRELTS